MHLPCHSSAESSTSDAVLATSLAALQARHPIRQVAKQLPPTDNNDKRGHASIEVSLEHPLKFINDELTNTTPKQIHLRKRRIGVERKQALRAA